jgi:hypothetical protein
MSEDPDKRPIDYIRPAIGFAFGTGIMGALVLSTEVRIRGLAGMVCGGIPFGLIGLWYAIHRARRNSG